MLERTSEGLLDMWVVLEAALRTSGSLGSHVDLVPFHDENHANSTVEGAEHAIVVQATCLLHPFEDPG